MLRRTTPILRSFDEAKARAFYLDFLGFKVVFEHRFHAGAPLYMGIARGDCHLHLSEHHGDATPGSSMRIEVGSAYTLVFFVVILPVLWGLQYAAHYMQKRYGT